MGTFHIFANESPARVAIKITYHLGAVYELHLHMNNKEASIPT